MVIKVLEASRSSWSKSAQQAACPGVEQFFKLEQGGFRHRRHPLMGLVADSSGGGGGTLAVSVPVAFC